MEDRHIGPPPGRVVYGSDNTAMAVSSGGLPPGSNPAPTHTSQWKAFDLSVAIIFALTVRLEDADDRIMTKCP